MFNRDKKKAVSDETRDALDEAIINVVQAIGSKAGILVFWDERRRAFGRTSVYGINETMLTELQPLVEKVVLLLRERALTSPDEVTALQTDIPTSAGAMNLIALPILIEGRFVAGLCLLQPLTGTDLPALPASGSLDLAPLEPNFGETPSDTAKTHSVKDEGILVARNARLLRRLVEEKQWLEAIIEYNADGILIVDRECNIVGFNPAFTRLSGWTVQELRGQNCTEALKLANLKGEGCANFCPLRLGLLAKSGEDERKTEVILTTKDGKRRYVELTYSVILSPNRDVLGGIIGTRDITARKEAEELQNTFLSVISHELQTPIAIIKGYAGLYADETTALDTKQVRDKMQIIYEESERLSKLVENLLYASRLQAGGVELQLAPISLVNLLNRTAKKLQNYSDQHKILVNVAADLPEVHADYDKIQEVLVNLVENGIKYSPRGGTIELTAFPSSTDVTVAIADEGIGIPEKERERVFDRFSRLDSRYVRERKGAGLGLYICKAIVEAHGGKIWVEASATPDNPQRPGSKFCFTLPREVPAQLPVLFGKV
jgi:PAS domain S-box-containing protein